MPDARAHAAHLHVLALTRCMYMLGAVRCAMPEQVSADTAVQAMPCVCACVMNDMVDAVYTRVCLPHGYERTT